MGKMRLAERQPLFIDHDCGLKSIVFPTESAWGFDTYCLCKGGFHLESTISWAYINPAPTYREPDDQDMKHFWDQESIRLKWPWSANAQHDPDCERELTSQGYTPCQCDERREEEMHNRDRVAILLRGVNAVHEDAKSKKLGRGKGGKSTMACPLCTDGTIVYTVANVNGHIWAKCSTDNCLKFIE